MTQQALEHDPARRELILVRTPLARLGDPADIGWAAVHLCSPAAGFVPGVVLPVAGSASIGFGTPPRVLSKRRSLARQRGFPTCMEQFP